MVLLFYFGTRPITMTKTMKNKYFILKKEKYKIGKNISNFNICTEVMLKQNNIVHNI